MRPVHWHLDLANTWACHSQAHQVDSYLASSLIILYPSAAFTPKPPFGHFPACSWTCYLAPKHNRAWLLTRGMQPAVLQADDERGYFYPGTSAGCWALAPGHTLSCFYCFPRQIFFLGILGYFLFECRCWNSFRNGSGLKLESLLGSS